jgi:hypothetical protein
MDAAVTAVRERTPTKSNAASRPPQWRQHHAQEENLSKDDDSEHLDRRSMRFLMRRAMLTLRAMVR